MNNITICRHHQLVLLDRVFEPKYSTQEFIVDKGAVRNPKVKEFKVRFSEVNDTSEWAGDWYVHRNNITKYKTYVNNGRNCYAVPLSELKRIKLKEMCEHVL